MYNMLLLDEALDKQKSASRKLIDKIETETDHGNKKISMFVRSVRGEDEGQRSNNSNISK